MLAKRIIPCLDVDAGRVVKGVRFEGLRDAGDPVELAARYDADGADELVFLDITATVEGRAAIESVIAQTAEQVFIPLTVGGGVREVDDVTRLLRAGADKVSVNSAAVRDPSLLQRLADRFGAQCIVVAIDARRVAGDRDRWEVFINGGRINTELDAVERATPQAMKADAGTRPRTPIARNPERLRRDHSERLPFAGDASFLARLPWRRSWTTNGIRTTAAIRKVQALTVIGPMSLLTSL